MTEPDRIPCINRRCKRTGSAEKFPGADAICCGKCWKRVPAELKNRHKRQRRLLRKNKRKFEQGKISQDRALVNHEWLFRAHARTWELIEDYLNGGADEPEGLSAFMEESGL